MASPAPYDPARFNMAAYVLRTARQHPDKPALIIAGANDRPRIWRYGEIDAAVRGIASGLIRAGLRPGDRVLLRLGNTEEFPLAFLGALLLGAVPVPTSAMLTETEVAGIIAQLRPALILRDEDLPCPAAPPCPVLPVARLVDFHSLPAAPGHMGNGNRPGYIVYTSGSSGRPLAVMHAHRAILARRMMWTGWYGAGPGDRFLHAGAFNWTYTLGTGLMDPWCMGATACVPAAGTSSEDLPAIMAQQNISIFAAAPGVYRQILNHHRTFHAPALRHGLTAGEKLPEHIRTAWHRATGTDLHEAYGMSECSTFISGSPARPAPAGTLGFAQPGRRVAIVDAQGHPLPAGQEGFIAIHRSDPGLMLGYWQSAAATQARFCDDWFLTGDTGLCRADGAICYLGRTDDMMNAGGYRVSPIEVEQVLCTHPEINEAAVVEIEVKPGTTVIAAFYISAAALDEASLARYIGKTLARYKQPRIFCHVTDLPKGANGKLLRRRLRQQYEADHDPA